jgi:hypothetical protein
VIIHRIHLRGLAALASRHTLLQPIGYSRSFFARITGDLEPDPHMGLGCPHAQLLHHVSTLLIPIGYSWSFLACRIGRSVPDRVTIHRILVMTGRRSTQAKKSESPKVLRTHGRLPSFDLTGHWAAPPTTRTLHTRRRCY